MDGGGQSWIGASLLRREDARHLLGKGQFLADIKMPGMQDVCFVRSPMAHATVTAIRKPPGREPEVFVLGDLPPIKLLASGPEIAAFRNTAYPPLCDGRVRFAGQPMAACLAPTRAEAEDLADLVEMDLDALPAVVDAVAAMQPGGPLIYDHWPDNAFITNTVAAGDVDALAARAPVKLRRQFRMNRQAVVTLEGRGALAYWDHRHDELVVYLSTQGPHVMRLGFAESLGLPEHKLRVVTADVGGGFGGKNRLMPEELAIAALAMKVDHPVRWVEDRREHLMASPHCREHYYDLTIYADTDGTLLGLDGSVYIDAGAYALWPTGAFAEAAMAARNLPGPYRIRDMRIKNFTVATNKPPMGPYRGVARPGACFAIERLVDEVARELGRDPLDLRRQNIVTSAELPYDTAGGMTLDTGDYVECLNAVERLVDAPAVRARQAAGEPDGRRIGLGYAFYTEQSGHGAAEWTRRRSRVVPGYETSTARMMPDGTLQLLVGIHSHGQGLETTLAQIAAHELGMDPANISVRFGDTAVSPFGFGTFASRSIVMAGGAVATSCRALAERIRIVAGHLLQSDPAAITFANAAAQAGAATVSFAEIGRVAHVRQDLMPEGGSPVLEATRTYEPPESGGAFSYATHAAVVAVDPDTGTVELVDYCVAEDCGTMINPMIVDGQVHGGVMQGIGTALFEEIPYDEMGQPLATTFADYHMPCASDTPRIRVTHLVTPALFTEFGVKGVGEGGAIAPPAAIANALADAFKGVGFNETPCTPRRICAAIAAAAS